MDKVDKGLGKIPCPLTWNRRRTSLLEREETEEKISAI